MSVIVHACSSVLIRPNGIVRYINACIDYQKSLGHTVIFVTDSKPSQHINADSIVYGSDKSRYVPNMKDGHVWLQIEPDVILEITQSFQKVKKPVDHVIAHDLHSYMALMYYDIGGIFIQHESDVLNQSTRQSFLSDDYLATQIKLISNSNWLTGLTSRKNTVAARRKLFTPIPFFPKPSPTGEKDKGLLYVGDTTQRKGAHEFMETAHALGVKPIVISHEHDSSLFDGAEVYSFSLTEIDKMFDLMRRCKVAYLPSRNETLCLAALECLQFMPVVVNREYEWTESVEEMGVLRISQDHRVGVLQNLINDIKGNNPRRHMLDEWCKIGQQVWSTLSA
jgi:hypothetical protein